MYQAFAAPSITWSSNNNPQSASFAFWSVTGAANGAFISSNQSLDADVGNSDVTVMAWYIPQGGPPGPGGPGIYIDAFDVNAGSFVDDDFVNVSPDAGLTAAANNDGWVPTASAENINAFASLPEGPFTAWNVFPVKAEKAINEQLQAAKQTSAVAFAFYQSIVGPPIKPGSVAANATWVSYGVTVDAGGPTGHGPVDPWGPFLRDFAAGLALAQTAKLVQAELRPQLLALASKQITVAAQSITEHLEQK
jgi:hypothetical protein